MSSLKKLKERIWTDPIKFKKQSLIGKIFLISVVLLLGFMLVFTTLVIFMDKWNELGKYPLLILFGWFFLIIITYIGVKLISLIMHNDKQKILQLEMSESVES